ncbi:MULTISPECIES: chorismate mutase [Salipiger]|uniref:chorismate mutase n=1 Tax=Salipiger bermudensis (strain DSM 26914 / JCM 13377 / KCTC 12554 / HTCC2601) TaxID=314265 RepID=Q0FL96_SALBH|nr:chorismate mutase [Salipiger bermudensis]EAU44975.1 chorismate mutase family protein [Salipiger bermudensis HTCC2601]MBN9676293.1 chorismate mutase [Salipiger bermudensis]MBR9890918.1 chorismate mutase [bacterium]MCA1285402.1 chorismate mutase [Salipiger bermudensis]
MRDPATLGDMTELRAEVDATDAALCDLLAHRARLISRAAELKKANGWPARIGGRVDEVIDNARRNAEAQGWDPELAEVLWRELVEWSIEREKAALGRE